MYKFYLIPMFSGAVNLLLGFLVIIANSKRRLNQLCFLLAAGLALWNFSAAFHSRSVNAERSLLLYRLGGIGVAIIPAALYSIAVETAGRKRDHRWTKFTCAVSALFICLILSGHPISKEVRHFGNMIRITGSLMVWLFYGYFLIVWIASLKILLSKLRAAHAHDLLVVKFELLGFSVLGAGIMHDSMPILGLDFYPVTSVVILPLGTLCAALYGFLLGYGLLSDQLLDFRVSIGRKAAATLRILFLLGIIYILLLVTGGYFPDTFTATGLAATVLIVGIGTTVTIRFFPKLLGNHYGIIESNIIGDRFESHDKIRAFINGRRPASETFQFYLERAMGLVSDQFCLSEIGIAIVGGDRNAQARAIKSVRPNHLAEIFAEKSPLRTVFLKANQPHIDIREGLRFRLKEHDVRNLMADQSLILVLPIGVGEKKPTGFLAVGSRRDGRSLNKLDADVLTLLCRHIGSRVEEIAVERNEELQRSNEAKDQFLASVNHEIRNPLNGITGIVRMLREHCPEDRAQYLLDTLQACTDQLRSTIDGVLDFNQIGPEVAANQPTEVDIVEIARSTTSSYDIGGGQLVFEHATSGFTEGGRSGTGIRVWCDSGKFTHILMNYLTNALKYGIPSGAKVKMTIEAVGKDVARIRLAVTSTGPTLSQDELLGLFTPLTRGRRAQETKAHGMGLGLALCKKLADAMGGNVGVESAHGKTTFWFVAEMRLVDSSSPETIPVISEISGRHALAIEDEPYNRLVLGFHLNRFGVTPVWAVDGASALAIAEKRPFDLILMDWVLPDMEGDELLARLRKTQSTPLPPVIVVSAYSSAAKQASGLAAGATAFLSKPIDEAKLAEAFAACKLGPPVAALIDEESMTESIDLSRLRQASENHLETVESFIRDIQVVHSGISADWQRNPRAAASLAHRLKGQMLLVRATDCSDLLALLEHALNSGGKSDDVGRLVQSVQTSFNRALTTIRSLARPTLEQP